MTSKATSGTEQQLRAAEESVPIENWLAWLKNLAVKCVARAHLPQKVGRKYSAADFWGVIVAHALLNLSLDEASNQLNDLLWARTNRRLRRKVAPKRYQGEVPRRERKCPNGDQCRKYRNALPAWVVSDLNRFIFGCQIDYALAEGLIQETVDVLVDNTDQWYYGGDRYPANPFITRGWNGPGTPRKRKHLALMLKSGGTYLFCGADLVRKGESNAPAILATLDWLAARGLRVRRLLGDRWFPTYGLLAELPARGVAYVGPYRKLPRVRRAVEDYIKRGGKGGYVVPYAVRGATAKYYGKAPAQAWLVLANRRGRRLRDIRQDYLAGRQSLADSVKEIMVLLVTDPPPAGGRARQAWAVNAQQAYDCRWQIETGFRDLNRLAPPSNARTNARQLFMRAVRYWVYNAWQLARAKRRQLRSGPKSWRRGPTLRRFTYCVVQQEVAA